MAEDVETASQELEQLLAVPPLTLAFASPLSSSSPSSPNPSSPQLFSPKRQELRQTQEYAFEFASEAPLQERLSEWTNDLRGYLPLRAREPPGKKPDWRAFAKRLYEKQAARSRDFVCWEARDVKQYHRGLELPRLPAVPEKPFHGPRRKIKALKENEQTNTDCELEVPPERQHEQRSVGKNEAVVSVAKVSAATQVSMPVLDVVVNNLPDHVEERRKCSGLFDRGKELTRKDTQQKRSGGQTANSRQECWRLRLLMHEWRAFEQTGLKELDQLVLELRSKQQAYQEQLRSWSSLSKARKGSLQGGMTKRSRQKNKTKAPIKSKVFFAGGKTTSSNVHVKASLERKRQEPTVTVAQDDVAAFKWKDSGFLLELLGKLVERHYIKIVFSALKWNFLTAAKRKELVYQREQYILRKTVVSCFDQLKEHHKSRIWLRERCQSKRVNKEEHLCAKYLGLWRLRSEDQIVSRGKSLNAFLYHDEYLCWKYFARWRASTFLNLFNCYSSTSVLLWRRLTLQGLCFYGWRNAAKRELMQRQNMRAALEGEPVVKARGQTEDARAAMMLTRKAKMEKFVAFRQQLLRVGRETLRSLKFELGRDVPKVRQLYEIQAPRLIAAKQKQKLSSWKLLAAASTSKDLQRAYRSSSFAKHLRFRGDYCFPRSLDTSLQTMVRFIRASQTQEPVAQLPVPQFPQGSAEDLAGQLHRRKLLLSMFVIWKELLANRRAVSQYKNTLTLKGFTGLRQNIRMRRYRTYAIVRTCEALLTSHVLRMWKLRVDSSWRLYLKGAFSPWSRWKQFVSVSKQVKLLGRRALLRRCFIKLEDTCEKTSLLRRVFSLYEERAQYREMILQDHYAVQFNILLSLFSKWRERVDSIVAERREKEGEIMAKTFYEQTLLRKTFELFVEASGKAFYGPAEWR